MIFTRLLFAAILAFTIGAYVMDCAEMMSLDEAMQCCDSMPCTPHHHADAQDCCKAMSSTHMAFITPSLAHELSYSAIVVPAVPHDGQTHRIEFAFGVTAALGHAPPSQASKISPLRI